MDAGMRIKEIEGGPKIETLNAKIDGKPGPMGRFQRDVAQGE